MPWAHTATGAEGTGPASLLTVPVDPLAVRFPRIVTAILPPGSTLRAEEVRAILALAFLSAEIDLDELPPELDLLDVVNRTLWEVSGAPREPTPIVSPLPLPNDQEARSALLAQLSVPLRSTGARELAYVVASLFTISDFELAPVERALVAELRRVLGIAEPRAAELVEIASEIVTPGVAEADP